ncbi:hypothetical protein DPM19_23505 [Actinomadura craniellae]|uniref:Uncharacterized protein n=1 Tax=Actinomadura craniellae TaxID=2231787 RepID=A0A365H0F8_9ACTN|nr:hypothetical protein [Actinomadura craniellae]RAY12572.1 hypothetical protein DPM19_23505 [Actinomadura craniellae]
MGLLLIDTSAEVLPGLRDIDDLYLVRSSIERMGDDRYRISGYAPETVIPELEARGCTVQVLMTSQDIDHFNDDVATAIAPPDDTPPES